MRTTVTLDPDVERLLKATAHKREKSFKVVLNEAVRQSLGPKKKAIKEVKLRTFDMGIHPHLAHRLPSEIDAELQIEEYLEKEHRPGERLKSKR